MTTLPHNPPGNRPADAEILQVKRLAESIPGLPALPAVAAQLMEAMDDPTTSAAELARLISSDPALTARLLKLANSTYYGFPRRIGTVNLAVVVLGLETVRDLSLSVLITDCFYHPHDDLPFPFDKFWSHSLTSAVAARLIFRLCGIPNPGEGFVAGLVHDIGKLFLGRYYPQKYAAALRRTEEGVSLLEAEREVFGAAHPLAGAWLLDSWNLPAWLVEAVRDHHAASGDAGRQALAISFADLLVRRAHFDGGGPRHDREASPEMVGALGLKKDVYGVPDYGAYLEKLRRELQRSEDMTEAFRRDSAPSRDPFYRA
ncbi:MAG: HDOD domain-containing protein [Candidatus Zixiibacteriota bacterium]|nr:MAG: HDOD domain-containing protein [candidate division Zixibacteria bacterium]